MKTLSSGSWQPALICWFCLKFNLKFSGFFCYSVNGSPPGKYFWLQPHPHNPVQRDMWCVEKSLHLLPQKPLQLEKAVPPVPKKKNLICNVVTGKAMITSAVAGGITLNPIVFTSLTVYGVIVKIVVGAAQDDRKIERANFTRAGYKKILDVIWFYLRGDPYSEKEFLD